MSQISTYFCILALALTISNALPTDLQPTTKENETTYNPFSPGFRWTNYNMAAFAAGIVIVGAGLAILAAFLFPIFGYRVCYALGGCQNTLDNYVNHLIGVDGHTKRINKRDVSSNKDMDYFMEFLTMAMRQYDDKATKERDQRTKTNIMRFTSDSDHQIEKRSPLDYIEPILVMMSKAYNEFVDPDLKKNFRKRLSIR